MKFENLAELSVKEFAEIKTELSDCKTLGQVLDWTNTKSKDDFVSQIVTETITQDEYTHDIIIPFRNLFLVFDTT